MPERYLRAGILSSDRVNALSWPGECFYRRLMSVVDDYGRYDGRKSVIRAALFPVKLDHVSEGDVVKWMSECSEAGLVNLYEVDGKPYLQIENFGQRIRSASKYPSPPHRKDDPPDSQKNLSVVTSADNCQQMSADGGPIRGRGGRSNSNPITNASARESTRAQIFKIFYGLNPNTGENKHELLLLDKFEKAEAESIDEFPKIEKWVKGECIRLKLALMVKIFEEAMLFFIHYTKTGWMDKNKNPIVNVQAAAEAWIRRSGQFEKKK